MIFSNLMTLTVTSSKRAIITTLIFTSAFRTYRLHELASSHRAFKIAVVARPAILPHDCLLLPHPHVPREGERRFRTAGCIHLSLFDNWLSYLYSVANRTALLMGPFLHGLPRPTSELHQVFLATFAALQVSNPKRSFINSRWRMTNPPFDHNLVNGYDLYRSSRGNIPTGVCFPSAFRDQWNAVSELSPLRLPVGAFPKRSQTERLRVLLALRACRKHNTLYGFGCSHHHLH
jgi:hypothetical protein